MTTDATRPIRWVCKDNSTRSGRRSIRRWASMSGLTAIAATAAVRAWVSGVQQVAWGPAGYAG